MAENGLMSAEAVKWVSLFATALLSGLIATVVTIWWNAFAEKRRHRYQLFETLMSNRFNITSLENVQALNLIDVVFYKYSAIREAFKDFKQEANKPEDGKRDIDSKYLKLLECIADQIGYGEVSWDTIKDFYYPSGLLVKTQGEMELLKLNIQVAQKQLKPKK